MLSQKEKNKLELLHPSLRAVVYRMDELLPQGFHYCITETVRSEDRQRTLYAQGYSQTLHSKHLVQDDGFSHAVDIVPIVDGVVSWDYESLFRVIGRCMFRAAIELGIQISWGGLWSSFKDLPHWEL